jgi:hypothetical protein
MLYSDPYSVSNASQSPSLYNFSPYIGKESFVGGLLFHSSRIVSMNCAESRTFRILSASLLADLTILSYCIFLCSIIWVFIEFNFRSILPLKRFIIKDSGGGVSSSESSERSTYSCWPPRWCLTTLAAIS